MEDIRAQPIVVPRPPARSYGGNKTTARHEFQHVVDPDEAPPLCKFTQNGAPSAELREKKPWQHYHTNAGMLIAQSFAGIKGWEKIDVAKRINKIALAGFQVIALRLYTGPCFMLYNCVLRASGGDGLVPL